MRVAVVNACQRETSILVSLVNSAGHEIAWCASDGSHALTCCSADQPDLVLVDLAMPALHGVQTTALLTERFGCAVIVVAPVGQATAAGVFQAMANGAIDVIPSPTLSPGDEVKESDEILYKIRLAGQLLDSGQAATRIGSNQSNPEDSPVLIAIGASAGGPRALSTVLSGMSRPLSGAVVIIQHIDSLFSEDLAAWLARESSLPVSLAKENEKPRKGQIVIAGTNDHMVLTSDRRFHYQAEPLDCVYRPSIDHFFESLRRHWPWPGIAALLTGMGKDGASGLLGLRQAGWHTIAQDRQSSAVYGMPRAAQDGGAALETLPLEQIAASISRSAMRLAAGSGPLSRV